MRLYHGSNLTVEKPVLLAHRRYLDFGDGFYTTTNADQAIAFSEKVVRRSHGGQATVSVYDFDADAAFAVCNVLRFASPDGDWLDFVSANRLGTAEPNAYDIIYGPVADDDVYTTFSLYETGVLTRQQTLETLKIRKLFDQMVFATERSLGFLLFVGVLDRGAEP